MTYDGWKADWDTAAGKFKPVLIEAGTQVAFVESSAGTGSRCVVVVSELPDGTHAAVGGASKLVSVMYPWKAVYAVNSDADNLSVEYLCEKFSGDVQSNRRHGGEMAQVVLTVKLAVFEFDRRREEVPF